MSSSDTEGCPLEVSVIVISKNAEKTIAKCLTSIMEQTHPPYEIIVIDGRSTDQTRDIALKFPVKLIIAPKKDTYGVSRNLGVKVATGDVVAFLDSDDYAEMDWLEKVVEKFNKGDIGMVNPRRFYYYPQNWFTDFMWKRKRKRGVRIEQPQHKEAWKSFGTSGGAFRRGLIQKAGLFDEDMFFGVEDKELAIRIMEMGYRVSFAPNAVIHFRTRGSVKEWLKDGFYRNGLGHGTIRRRYGKFNPPWRHAFSKHLLTPLIMMSLTVCFLSSVLLGKRQLAFFITLIFVLGILLKAGLMYKTKKDYISSLKYVLALIAVRNIELIGYAIGYLIPTKVLRKIARR